MPKSEDQYRTPLLEKYRLQLILPTFSRTWITIMAMATQGILCGLVWIFAGIMMGGKIIPLPDNLASWTHNNPSDMNMLITAMATILGIVGSW